MNLSRTVILLFVLSPFSFGASKEIVELQRDVAMLQDQVRNLQRGFDEKISAMQTLVQQTLESVNRTNTAVAVMQNSFAEAVKRQQESVAVPVTTVGQKLDAMSEDFRAVREAVLDMNTRMNKLDAKMADLQNLVNTLKAPPPPPPNPTLDPNAPGGATSTAPAVTGPPPGMTASASYTNAFKDYTSGKNDIAIQEFTDYLKYYPDTDLAANAQFYVGDIYYRREDWDNAVKAFDAVLERYSDNNKTADAHFMKGLCLMKTGRNDAAAREFRTVAQNYSDTDVAAKAKARLREMGLSVGTAKGKSTKRRP